MGWTTSPVTIVVFLMTFFSLCRASVINGVDVATPPFEFGLQTFDAMSVTFRFGGNSGCETFTDAQKAWMNGHVILLADGCEESTEAFGVCCSYEDRVRNIQNAGAIGGLIIAGPNVPGHECRFHDGSDTADITIPLLQIVGPVFESLFDLTTIGTLGYSELSGTLSADLNEWDSVVENRGYEMFVSVFAIMSGANLILCVVKLAKFISLRGFQLSLAQSCLWLLLIANLERTVYFCVDPYFGRMIFTTIYGQVLMTVANPISLIAEVVVIFYWLRSYRNVAGQNVLKGKYFIAPVFLISAVLLLQEFIASLGRGSYLGLTDWGKISSYFNVGFAGAVALPFGLTSLKLMLQVNSMREVNEEAAAHLSKMTALLNASFVSRTLQAVLYLMPLDVDFWTPNNYYAGFGTIVFFGLLSDWLMILTFVVQPKGKSISQKRDPTPEPAKPKPVAQPKTEAPSSKPDLENQSSMPLTPNSVATTATVPISPVVDPSPPPTSVTVPQQEPAQAHRFQKLQEFTDVLLRKQHLTEDEMATVLDRMAANDHGLMSIYMQYERGAQVDTLVSPIKEAIGSMPSPSVIPVVESPPVQQQPQPIPVQSLPKPETQPLTVQQLQQLAPPNLPDWTGGGGGYGGSDFAAMGRVHDSVPAAVPPSHDLYHQDFRYVTPRGGGYVVYQ